MFSRRASAALHEGGEGHKVIVKHMEVDCVSDSEDECEDHMVWVSDGEEIDIETLIEKHGGGDAKVIRIHKSHEGDMEFDGDTEHKVIVKKKTKKD